MTIDRHLSYKSCLNCKFGLKGKKLEAKRSIAKDNEFMLVPVSAFSGEVKIKTELRYVQNKSK